MRIFYLILGFSSLLTHADSQGLFQKQVAALPWTTSVPIVNCLPSDAQITITAMYVKPNVVEDTDTNYISVHPTVTSLDKNGVPRIHSVTSTSRMKDRDCIGGWCDGSGQLEKTDINGFDYRLKLSWEMGKESITKYDEIFHCLWVKEQTFKRNGLTITISAKIN